MEWEGDGVHNNLDWCPTKAKGGTTVLKLAWDQNKHVIWYITQFFIKGLLDKPIVLLVCQEGL